MSRVIREYLIVPSALLGVAVLVFPRLVLEPGSILVDAVRASVDRADKSGPRPIGNDQTFFFLPHHMAIGQHVRTHGRPPFWDTRGFGGRPLVGNPQAGVFYPPVWLAWVSRAPATLGWITIGHLIWGGLGVYRLSRFLGRSPPTAVVAGGMFEASPLLLAHVAEGHLPHVWSVAWYPWAFWAFARARRGDPRGFLILVVVLAAAFLAGHPQEWLFLSFALAAWTLADLVRSARSNGLEIAVVRAAPFVAAFALSLGLSAPDLVPQLAVRPWLVHDRMAPGYEPPAHYFVHLMNALQLIDPTALGGPADYFGDDNYWETVCSIGLAGLVLAVAGARSAPEREQVRGWLSLLGFSLWFACGRGLGFSTLVGLLVPGMGLVRAPGRALFLANLAACLLAGMGLDVVRASGSRSELWKAPRGPILAAIFVVGGLIVIGRAWGPPAAGSNRLVRAADRIAHEPRTLAVTAALALIAITATRANHHPRATAAALGALALVELARAGFVLMPVARLEQFVLSTSKRAIESAVDDRFPFRAPNRVKARDAAYGDLQAVWDGVEKTNINDSFQLDAPSRLYETLYDAAPARTRPFARALPMFEPAAAFQAEIRQAVFDRISVAALVSDRVEEACPWPIAAGRGSTPGLVIATNWTALPRAYVVPTAIEVSGPPSVILSAFREHNPRLTVVMDRDPLANLPAYPREQYKEARWFRGPGDRIAVEVETSAPCLLVVADTWMPGWTAWVDGQPAETHRGNLCQRVVALPTPGPHRVEMAFVPPGLVPGAVAAAISAVVWAMLWAVSRGRRLTAFARLGSDAGRSGDR